MAGVLEDPTVSVVLIGSFEPALGHPVVLGNAGVIRQDEAEAARFNTLVPSQALDFALTWCNVTVLLDRFIVQTRAAPFIKIADLVEKTVSDVMPNAAVTKLGINLQYTIRFTSESEIDSFGMRLAPPSAWGEWGKEIQRGIHRDPTKSHGGVISVTMRETPVEGRELGWRDVQIIATRTAAPNGYTAAIALNDHFEVDDSKDAAGLDLKEVAYRHTSSLMRTLSEQFDVSLKKLESIAHGILSNQQ